MTFLGLASILFAATAVNHLGLISAVERLIRHELYILNCAKCLTFWLSLIYCRMSAQEVEAAVKLAIPCLNAYLAIWLELGMGYIDTL